MVLIGGHSKRQLGTDIAQMDEWFDTAIPGVHNALCQHTLRFHAELTRRATAVIGPISCFTSLASQYAHMKGRIFVLAPAWQAPRYDAPDQGVFTDLRGLGSTIRFWTADYSRDKELADIRSFLSGLGALEFEPRRHPDTEKTETEGNEGKSSGQAARSNFSGFLCVWVSPWFNIEGYPINEGLIEGYAMPRALIHFTHGLGDAVQLTCVLQHLQKYRPDWELYLQAQRGKHSVGHGYCRRVWHDQEPSPDHAFFHQVFKLGLV